MATAMNMAMAMVATRTPKPPRSWRRSSLFTDRSAKSWAARGALAIAAAGLGVTSVAATLSAVVRSKDPARAHALAPWDGRATGQLALKQFVDLQTAKAWPPGTGLALQALQQDPMVVPAVTMLGLHSEQRGDSKQARRWFAYGQRLTRRDLLAELWAIEDAVSREDIAGALRHYDIALRTSSHASDLLFPILVEALADPRIRINLRKTLALRPPWTSLFIEYAAGNGADPRATALLFRDLSRDGHSVSDLARELLIGRLAAANAYDQAWAYYASFRRNPPRRTARDPNFAAELTNPTLFDWQSVATDGLSASIERGVLDFAAPASASGTLVRQVQMLPAGEYRLSGHSMMIDQPEDALPYWLLSCQNGRELGRVAVPNSSEASGNFTGRMTVPQGCSVQTLALVARASSAVQGLVGQFDRILLQPIR